MLCICSNLRNKKVNVKRVDSEIFLNNDKVDVKSVFFQKCSGTYEFFETVLELNTPWNKKDVIFLNASWLKKASKNADDDELIENLNAKGQEIFEGAIELNDAFRGRVDGTFEMANIYFTNNCLIAPCVRLFRNLSSLEAVFLERMASYQKDFDITFCFDSEVLTVNSVTRKLYYKTVRKLFPVNVYEGGPEPISWPLVLKDKKRTPMTWLDVHKKYGANEEEVDDDDSDWDEESEEEDDDDEEFDNAVESGESEEDEIEEIEDDEIEEDEIEDEIEDDEECVHNSKRMRTE